MPSRARRTGPPPPISRFLNRTVPALGRVTPVRMLIRVDLPAPLGPTIETNSPASTPRLTPSSAQNSPYIFRSPSAWRITRDPSAPGGGE